MRNTTWWSPAAAISAARLGAKTLLIEGTGSLGGMGTSGLVTAFDPMANGEEGLVGGVMREIVETMYKRGFLGPQVTPEFWRRAYHRWTPFRPEGLKLILDEFAIEAGVEVRFFTRLIDADVDGNKINGVVVNNIEGHRYVPAKTFIDATGDAVLAGLCGAECREAGRDTDRIMPGSLCSLFAGIDWERVLREAAKSNPDTDAPAGSDPAKVDNWDKQKVHGAALKKKPSPTAISLNMTASCRACFRSAHRWATSTAGIFSISTRCVATASRTA